MFIRLGKLADKLVGKTARGKRPFIRWPEALVDLKKACAGIGVGKALIATGLALIAIPLILEMMFGFYISFGTAALALIAGGVGLPLRGAWTLSLNLEEKRTERVKKASETMKPLLGKDPYLDLQLAAFLTVGVMPEWLRKQMLREPDPVEGPGWQKTRLAAEPYTVERAGLDYLDLMSEIELRGKAPCGEFRGEPFPSLDYRLPSSLKDSVGKIILLLSSLPDSGEAPGEDAVEAVMDAIDRLATIDGRSFVAATRDSFTEERDKEKADYNGEVMNAVYASMHAQTFETGERSKTVQENMETLRKMSETAAAPAPAVEASDPSQALAAKARAGSKIARGLIDQYAALEATATGHGESIEVLRSKFTQGFAAMDDLLTVSEDAADNSDFYEDPKAISELVLRGEQGLRSKMVEEARLINSGNVLKAQASAAYLSSAN